MFLECWALVSDETVLLLEIVIALHTNLSYKARYFVPPTFFRLYDLGNHTVGFRFCLTRTRCPKSKKAVSTVRALHTHSFGYLVTLGRVWIDD